MKRIAALGVLVFVLSTGIWLAEAFADANDYIVTYQRFDSWPAPTGTWQCEYAKKDAACTLVWADTQRYCTLALIVSHGGNSYRYDTTAQAAAQDANCRVKHPYRNFNGQVTQFFFSYIATTDDGDGI